MKTPVKIVAIDPDGEQYEIGVVSEFKVSHTREVARIYESIGSACHLEVVPGSQKMILTATLVEELPSRK